jgi:hypothetical protein
VEVHDLRVLTGCLNSFALAMQPVRLFTRGLYSEIAAAEGRGDLVRLGERALADMEFWETNLDDANGAPISESACQVTLFSDASETGFGAHVGEKKVGGPLPADVIGKSSTRRELEGLLLGLRGLAQHLQHKRILIKMDSLPAIRNLVKGGGPSADLTECVKQIWAFCNSKAIVPSFGWVSRGDNTVADSLSRVVEEGGVMDMKLLQTVQGWCEEQALAKGWERFPTYLVQFRHIGRLLILAGAARAIVCVIHPVWPAQAWWPVLLEHVVAGLVLPKQCFAAPVWGLQGKPINSWDFRASILDFRMTH